MISCLLLHLAERDVVLRLEGGALRYSAPPGAYTAELREAVATHRAGIIVALATCPAEPWFLHHHDADELLVHLHASLIRAKHEHHGGAYPIAKANAIGIWLEVAESYIRHHAIEAARGWDAMALLHGAVESCLATARRGAKKEESPGGKAA
jgi:hypothetical protein